jgi:CDP-glycerol glycerophosphotransferase (TagB/SpsB family)
MMISSYSTLSLDAAAFDKPVINVAFDGTPKPYAESVARWETVTYFAAVLQSGAVRDVHSKEELRAAINAYFAHPELEAKERAELRSYFCFAIDGKSGKRFAAVIERELEKTL